MVSIYMDGTISISPGGIEMGQGLNTKVAQATSMALGVPMDLITLQVSSTATNPNSMTTGGSIGSELSVSATLDACKILNQRLYPLRKTLGNPTWAQLITAAYNAGVQLYASGFSNPQPSPNGPNQYNSYGVVCLEVELDVLTGEIQIVRSDVLFDCGISMNPAIDLGQIEGGFVQGLGLHLTEDILYTEDGQPVCDGTWEYKPPSSKDIPIQFNVTLLKNSQNAQGLLSSKAVGEPPLCMAAVGLFAVQHAVAAARNDISHREYFELDSPATVDHTQQSCLVDISQFVIN